MAKMTGFKVYKGTKETFISSGKATANADAIVYITGGAGNEKNSCIFAQGVYFADINEMVKAINYVKGINVGGQSYNATQGGGYVAFGAKDPTTVAINAGRNGIEIGLTDAFINKVDDVVALAATINGDYLKAADRTALESLISTAKAEILGNAQTDTKDSKTIEGVRKYVDEKTSGIASEGVVSDLSNRVGVIEGDYLKNADKTALQGAIDVEKGRVDAIVADYLKAADKTELANSIKAISDDYLKGADKTELTGMINADRQRLATIEGQDAGKSAREIVQDEVAKQLQSENISESFDTLKEMAEYLSGHPEDVTEMSNAIKQNADDIDAIEENLKTLATAENLGNLEVRVKANEDAVATVDSRIEAAEGRAKTYAEGQASAAEGRINTKLADYAKTADVNTELGKKADKTQLNDYYKKTETYTQTEVNNLVSPKADKSYVDEELGKLAVANNVYTKEEINAMFSWETIA